MLVLFNVAMLAQWSRRFDLWKEDSWGIILILTGQLVSIELTGLIFITYICQLGHKIIACLRRLSSLVV